MSYTNPDKVITSPLDAIREMCLDCCGGERSWIAGCTATKCALYEFRFGKNPYRKSKEYTEEEKEILKERIKNAREIKKNKSV